MENVFELQVHNVIVTLGSLIFYYMYQLMVKEFSEQITVAGKGNAGEEMRKPINNWQCKHVHVLHETYFQNPDIFQTSYKALMFHNSGFEVYTPLQDKFKEL